MSDRPAPQYRCTRCEGWGQFGGWGQSCPDCTGTGRRIVTVEAVVKALDEAYVHGEGSEHDPSRWSAIRDVARKLGIAWSETGIEDGTNLRLARKGE